MPRAKTAERTQARRMFVEDGRTGKEIAEVLHLSESAAYMRIAVARAAWTCPVLLDMLRDGRLHLTAIKHIAPLLLDCCKIPGCTRFS